MRRLRFRPWCNLLLFILPLVAVGPAARVLAAAPENRAATDVQPAPGGSGFDVAAATAAYLAKVPLEQILVWMLMLPVEYTVPRPA